MKHYLLIFAFVIFSYTQLEAQVTTSSITGVVTQATGAVTAGATVVATHVPSGTVYTSSANATGRFNLSNMRVGGPYKIIVTYVGQKPLLYEDVYLQLGQPFVLNPIFGDNYTELEGIAITRYGSHQNNNKTGAGTNVGLKQIQELPQVSRSITEFTRLTPQANGPSFAGRDGRYNNLQIDGANFNNGFGLSTDPLPGGSFQPISLDAIEEISVNIAPYDVTQSGFTGAGINAVTKSGTNEYHGTVYGFFNNQRFNGLKIDDVSLPYELGSKQTYGFTLGGPIIKDKLFLFLSAEREQADGVNAPGANRWKANTKANASADPSNNITRVYDGDLDAVADHLKDIWGYDPGPYQGYADDTRQKGTKLLARLDWNIDEKHKFALRYNQLVGTSDQVANANSGPQPRSNYGRISENSMTFKNGNYGFENSVRSLTAELNSTFTSQLSNKFLVTYSRIEDKRTVPNNSLFPFVDIWDGDRGDGRNNYISFGTELFSHNNGVKNDNLSFTNNLTYAMGNHNITMGAAFDYQKFANSYVRMGTGYYRYASVEDFLTTGTANEVAPIMFGLGYPYEGQDTYSRANYGLASLYAQDRYSVSERFNFTVGLRAELPIYMNRLTGNPSVDALEFLDRKQNSITFSSSSWPKSTIMLSPRLGFNYDALGDRSLVVRGGTGIFTGRIPFVWLTNMPSTMGVLQNTIEPGGYDNVSEWIDNVRFNPDNIYHYLETPPAGAEDVFLKNPEDGIPGSITLVDNRFKMPSVWRTSLGADYRIPNTPITLTTDILYTKEVFAVTQYGVNRKNSGQYLNNAGDNREFYPNEGAFTYNEKIGGNSAVILTNTDAKGHALSATFGATLASWNGLSGSLFYTYSEAKEQSNNPGSAGVSAWGNLVNINNPNDQKLYNSNFAVPHRIVASLNYTFQHSTVGIYYNGSHQGRFSYIYNGDVNGDGLRNDLIYLPSSSSEMNFVNITDNSNNILYTVDEQRAAYEEFLAENGLMAYQGKYLERNQFLMPWLNRVDIRWTQNIFNDIARKGDKLQFTVDVVNLGNLLNKKWGIQDNLYTSGSNFLNASLKKDSDGDLLSTPEFRMAYDKDGLVTTPFRQASTTSTTWSAVLGVRYSF